MSSDGTAAGPAFTTEQMAQVQAMLTQLEEPVKQIMWNTLRGILLGFPGVPPHAVLSMAAMQAGLFMGQAISGELSAVLQIRRGFQDSFAEGVRKTPPNVKAMTAPPPRMNG